MTAIEWLAKQILVEIELYTDEQGNWIDNTRIAYVNAYKDSVDLKAFVEQALEMEKQQIMEAYMKAKLEHITPFGFNIIKNKICMETEKYYNETYKPST